MHDLIELDKYQLSISYKPEEKFQTRRNRKVPWLPASFAHFTVQDIFDIVGKIRTEPFINEHRFITKTGIYRIRLIACDGTEFVSTPERSNFSW